MADAEVAVGVPEKIAVLVEKLRPAGTSGETDQEETAPPELVGERDVIAELTVPTIESGEYEMFGAASVAETAMETVAVSDPAEFEPVTV